MEESTRAGGERGCEGCRYAAPVYMGDGDTEVI